MKPLQPKRMSGVPARGTRALPNLAAASPFSRTQNLFPGSAIGAGIASHPTARDRQALAAAARAAAAAAAANSDGFIASALGGGPAASGSAPASDMGREGYSWGLPSAVGGVHGRG